MASVQTGEIISIVLAHVQEGDADRVFVAGTYSARHLATTHAARLVNDRPEITVNVVDTFLDAPGHYPGFRINPR
jgi:hypothetical protein